MHPTHPMNADSGCPELHHKTQAWTQLTSHSLLSPPTAFDSLPQCITASYSIGCQNTAHQSFPQWPETAHSKMVNQNEQTHELTHIDTAPNAIEPTHSIPQQPGGQHSITDSPDTLRTPQHTAQDEILSLAFASPVINSTGGDDSTQWHTAGTQGLVRTEQQATASPHPVDAVREAGRPHTRHKIEKRTERGTINSKDHFKNKTHNFCCYFCCYYCYYYCGYCYTGCICVLQQYLPVYQDLDKTSPLNKMKISEQGRRKITRRTRRTRGRRDTDTQTHTHIKRKPLQALDLSCDSGNSDPSVTKPLCDSRSADSRKQGLGRPGVRSGVTGEGNSALPLPPRCSSGHHSLAAASHTHHGPPHTLTQQCQGWTQHCTAQNSLCLIL
ncbi:uncharacterized protein LOC135096651 isoform X1 [Scylla paramamosain]|uniref:uncharacterized protein LOC135096651 isoform X1 n=1 Tax=Scylla paramamosain TaxID=85552 RepID=UPI0030830FB6